MRASSGLANVVVFSLLLGLASPARADWDSGTGCAVAGTLEPWRSRREP